MNGRRIASVACGVVLSLLFGQAADAVPIQITSGGFTAFNGQSAGTDGQPIPGVTGPFGAVSNGCDAGFQGIVAGITVQAGVCPLRQVGTSFLPGISGEASLTFPSLLASFEFYEKAFGVGELPRNGFSFARNEQTLNVSDITNEFFVLGTLSFTNGTWFGTGKVNRFHLEITATSTDPLFGTQKLSDDLILDIRVGDTAKDNADCFSFSQFAALGQVCAYEPGTPGESNKTTVTVVGKKGSLIAVEFINVEGGFLIPATPTAVPEPATLALLALGLAGLAAVRRKRG